MSDGVIHDIGYRRYTGARVGKGTIAASLFQQGVFSAFGIGRSGKSKTLPMAMFIMSVLPAIIMVAIMVTTGFGEGFIDYSTYVGNVFFFVVIFVAAQAPAVFSRDLQSGAITLYLSRPLSSRAFALVRWASLFTAIFAFLSIPIIVLYGGALAAEADFTEHTGKLLAALAGNLILAAILASFSGAISAYTNRRALAVGSTIVLLLISHAVSTAIKAMAEESGEDGLGRAIGVVSPFTLTDGLQAKLLDGNAAFPLPPDSAGMTLLYVAAALFVILGGTYLIMRRFRKMGAR